MLRQRPIDESLHLGIRSSATNPLSADSSRVDFSRQQSSAIDSLPLITHLLCVSIDSLLSPALGPFVE